MNVMQERQDLFAHCFGLDTGKKTVAAVVGGGGKTTLIWKLCEELVQMEKKVIVTTTTHMGMEPERPFVRDGHTDEILEMLERFGYVLAASVDEKKGKLTALHGVETEERLRALGNICDVLLIEADGARRMPLKTPEAWEPVIPKLAHLVIGVMGLDSLYQPIKAVACRPEQTAAFLQKGVEELVTEEDLIKLAASNEGLRKAVEGRRYFVYLNKADVLPDRVIVGKIADVLEEKHISCVFGSLHENWICSREML